MHYHNTTTFEYSTTHYDIILHYSCGVRYQMKALGNANPKSPNSLLASKNYRRKHQKSKWRPYELWMVVAFKWQVLGGDFDVYEKLLRRSTRWSVYLWRRLKNWGKYCHLKQHWRKVLGRESPLVKHDVEKVESWSLVSSREYFSVFCSGLKPYSLFPKLLMKNYNNHGNHRLANPASRILIRKR